MGGRVFILEVSWGREEKSCAGDMIGRYGDGDGDHDFRYCDDRDDDDVSDTVVMIMMPRTMTMKNFMIMIVLIMVIIVMTVILARRHSLPFPHARCGGEIVWCLVFGKHNENSTWCTINQPINESVSYRFIVEGGGGRGYRGYGYLLVELFCGGRGGG